MDVEFDIHGVAMCHNRAIEQLLGEREREKAFGKNEDLGKRVCEIGGDGEKGSLDGCVVHRKHRDYRRMVIVRFFQSQDCDIRRKRLEIENFQTHWERNRIVQTRNPHASLEKAHFFGNSMNRVLSIFLVAFYALLGAIIYFGLMFKTGMIYDVFGRGNVEKILAKLKIKRRG